MSSKNSRARFVVRLFLSLFIILFLGIQANEALAIRIPTDNVAAGKPVLIKKAALLAAPYNCIDGEILIIAGVRTVTYPDNWLRVIPPDVTKDRYYFCSLEVFKTLSLRDTSQDVTGWQTNIIWIINGLASLSASIAIYILNLVSKLLGYTLGIGAYVTNPFVTSGWPFVQGIANIGFILALLYIALGTTLEPAGVNLLGGQGARRLLPRLLIAALLINFSLVIGGILIDASRVFMAIMVNIVGGGGRDIATIGLDILKTSGIIGTVFKAGTSWGVSSNVGSNNWGYAFMSLRGTIMIWALTIGMAVIAFGMFIRYIALILLLIASPMAYLLIILPQTEKLAKQWWREFIKWVLYGPIALFILVLITGTTRFLPSAGIPKGMEEVFNVIITVAMLLVAATFGKSLGGQGSNAIMNFAGRAKGAAYNLSGARLGVAAGKKTGDLAVAGAKGAANIATAPVRYVGRGIKNQAGDFVKTAKKSISSGARAGNLGGIAKFIAGPERDEEGKLKDGQSSGGKRAAKAIFGSIDPEEITKKEDSNTIKKYGALNATDVLAPSGKLAEYLNPIQLAKGHVAKAFGVENIKVILENTKQSGTAMAVARNTDFLRDLADNKTTISSLLSKLDGNKRIQDQDKAKFAGTMNETLKKIREA